MRNSRHRWRANKRPDSLEDWTEVQELERDILLLYHQLIEYDHLMGDLSYDTVYRLPYWEYVNPTGLTQEQDQQQFIREGCLVMILAMAWDLIDESGTYISRHIADCRSGVAGLTCENADTQKLIGVVVMALDLAERAAEALRTMPGVPDQDRLDVWHKAVPRALVHDLSEQSMWVYRHYVRGYYERIVREFK